MSCCNRNKPLLRRTANIISGFAYLAAGVNDDVANERKKFCDVCPELRGGLQCKICGCMVDAKVRVLGEVCPLNKW